MKVVILFFISLFSLGYSPIAEEEKKLWELSPDEFFAAEVVKKRINVSTPDHYLLSIAIFQATNALREEKGLPLFLPDRKLHLAGATHISEMRKHHFFGHNNPYNTSQKNLSTRILNKGGDFHIMSENLALLPAFNVTESQYQYRKRGRKYQFFNLDGSKLLPHTYESFAKEVVYEWYLSKGHRRNLLNSELTHIGIAVFIETFHYGGFELPSIYAVQEFGGYM